MTRVISDKRMFEPSDFMRSISPPPTWLARMAALALCAWGASAVLPAAAQEAKSSWEQGCAIREVQPGSGDSLRQYNCTRQKDCQQMANAKGAATMELGCFFVSPSARPPAPAAGRTRPTQQQ